MTESYPDFTIKYIDVNDRKFLQDFLGKCYNKFPNHDIFTAEHPFSIGKHYHPDFEARLILDGSCNFIIDGQWLLAEPGTYIEISPNVPHSFLYDSKYPLKVYRFFSTESALVGTYCA